MLKSEKSKNATTRCNALRFGLAEGRGVQGAEIIQVTSHPFLAFISKMSAFTLVLLYKKLLPKYHKIIS